MLEAIHSKEGLIVLTASEGVGKTTVCRMAERDLDRRTLLALVVDPPPTIEQLLQTVLVDFGVVSRGDLAGAPRLDLDAFTSTLTSFLKSLVTLKANAVVVIDEAQRCRSPCSPRQPICSPGWSRRVSCKSFSPASRR